MEKEVHGSKEKYELAAESPNGSKVVFPILKKRSLLGRSQTCDIVIPFNDVSSIHCVLEKTKKGHFKVYDLNSKNGTRIDGKRIVVEDLGPGQEFYLGDNKVTLKAFNKSDIPSLPLDMLGKLPPQIPPEVEERGSSSLPASPPPSVVQEADDIVPRVQYPLAKDPKAEFSEYIFEDADELYPIFKYDISKSTVEVIIVFNDRIYSVDYLPPKDGVYSLTGRDKNSRSINYPYLGKQDEVPFIQIKNGEPEILPLSDYEIQTLGDTTRENSHTPFFLYTDEIVRFTKQHIQIFVRRTDLPPEVAHAPILRRDKEFKKYLLLMFFLVFSFLIPFSLFEVDEELEEEKAPERIATILYKKKLTASKSKAIDKTEKAPKKIQKSPKISKKKSQDKQKSEKAPEKETSQKTVAKSGSKTATKVGKVKKASPNKGPKDIKKDTVRPTRAKSASSSNTSSKVKAASRTNTKTQGRVDTYRSSDFKSTVSSLISKGGGTKSAKAISATSAGIGGSSISGAETGATLKTAKVSKNTGSLAGVTSGKLDSSKGVEGLVDKKSIYTAGLPFKTVILGGIDPDVIRQILVDNIPKFRYCYQKALDRSKAAFNGIVRLNFIIGASGHVSKAGVDSISSLPANVKSCVVNVLRRIRFPEPLGGGVVEVNQPMNFYPRVK